MACAPAFQVTIVTFLVQHDDAVVFDVVHHEMKNLIAAAELIFGAPAPEPPAGQNGSSCRNIGLTPNALCGNIWLCESAYCLRILENSPDTNLYIRR